MKPKDQFTFRHFTIKQDQCAMKVGVDAVTLGAWVPTKTAPKSILDIGTGTGILALMLAQRFPEARITAVEIDEAAAQQAQENVADSNYSDRVRVVCSSIQDCTALKGQTFDLIICNPPFFSGGVLSDQLARATARHTVKLSHGDLLASVRKYLAPKGQFALVLPKIEALRFRELAGGMNLFANEVLELRPRLGKSVHRLFQTFQRGEEAANIQSLIQYEGDEWTKDFSELVGSFYLEEFMA